jgi:membrane protein
MKGRESLLGTLAVLGLAAAVAYLAPEQQHLLPRSRPKSDEPASADDAFAPGRGRHAASPQSIPAKGWKDILWRTYEQFNEDRLLAVAAGVVFYGLLALFPTITALVSSYALFADAKTVSDHMAFLSGFLPEGSFSIIQDQVSRVLSKGDMKLGGAFLGSLLLAIWSANGGMKAIIDAIEAGGVIGILFAIGLVVITPVALSMVGLGSAAEALIRFGRWPVLGAILLLALAFLYRYAPSRRSPKWRWISVGSIVATITWMIGFRFAVLLLGKFRAL